ncbi:hypothetical protein BC830DRAFT_1174981 [Chytriomyces sp. MP71]|nr:hypothetical protein BC830DRAFT_1174981 [Chytriomyces sp. MP71]
MRRSIAKTKTVPEDTADTPIALIFARNDSGSCISQDSLGRVPDTSTSANLKSEPTTIRKPAQCMMHKSVRADMVIVCNEADTEVAGQLKRIMEGTSVAKVFVPHGCFPHNASHLEQSSVRAVVVVISQHTIQSILKNLDSNKQDHQLQEVEYLLARHRQTNPFFISTILVNTTPETLLNVLSTRKAHVNSGLSPSKIFQELVALGNVLVSTTMGGAEMTEASIHSVASIIDGYAHWNHS